MKSKPKFSYGQTVYHRALNERMSGIVVCVVEKGPLIEYVVDWGPSEGITENHEVTLTEEFTPKFGD